MAIGVVATLKVQDGKGAELEEVFRALRAGVRANEPGNKLYRMFKSRQDANAYIVMEIYENEDAINFHRASEHFRAGSPKLGALLAEKPGLEYFDAV